MLVEFPIKETKKSKMAFHPHVLEIKNFLDKSDERSEIMRKLTEPKESVYLQEYEAMWNTLFKAEKNIGNDLDNKWVSHFLDSVKSAITLPLYFYINGQERQGLIDKIYKHTRALKKIYEGQKLNQNLISNDGQFFDGFSCYDEKDVEDKGRKPKVSVTDTLDFFAERAEEAINESAYKGKAGKNTKAIRFVRILAARNITRYEKPLNAAIKTAAFALYGIQYEDSDIANLRKRRNL